MADCAESLGESVFESTSFVSGMGMDNIRFVPNANLMRDDEKIYLKIALKTRELNSSSVMSLSTDVIEVTKKDVAIDFYETFKNDDGSYDYNEERICTNEDSSILCPVYPYQILAAKANVDGEIHGYFWEVDGERIYAPQNCEGGCEMTNDEALVYFPITQVTDSIKEVTLNIQVQRTGEEYPRNIISTRNISIRNPLAIIRSNDTGSAWSRNDGDEYAKVFSQILAIELSLELI